MGTSNRVKITWENHSQYLGLRDTMLQRAYRKAAKAMKKIGERIRIAEEAKQAPMIGEGI